MRPIRFTLLTEGERNNAMQEPLGAGKGQRTRRQLVAVAWANGPANPLFLFEMGSLAREASPRSIGYAHRVSCPMSLIRLLNQSSHDEQDRTLSL